MAQITIEIVEPEIAGRTLADLNEELNALEAEFRAQVTNGGTEGSNVLVRMIQEFLPRTQAILSHHAILSNQRDAIMALIKSRQRAQVARQQGIPAKEIQQRLSGLTKEVAAYCHSLASISNSPSTAEAENCRQNGVSQETVNSIMDEYQ